MKTSERRAEDQRRALAWTELCSAGLAAGVLVQAVLAGQFLTSRPGLLDFHRILAEAIPLAAIALVALTWRRRELGSVGQRMLQLSVLSLVAIVIQTGLGFAGRSSPTAVAVHVPLGVALFGCLLWITFAAHSQRRTPGGDPETKVG
jgi:hypothetical protein